MNEKEYLFGDIPVLIVYKEIEKATQQGCILFFHGLSASKEANLNELRALAEDGFVAVGVDNYAPGRRRLENFTEIFNEKNPDVERDFLNAVIHTANDVPKIIDELIQKGFIKTEKIGVAGISMGGYITYTAITVEPRIKVAACIIGSPKYKLDMPESPHNHIDKFNRIILLSQNAGQDTIVPTPYAREFHETLKKEYADYEARFNYIEYPNSDHMMNPEAWEMSIRNLREWFKRYL